MGSVEGGQQAGRGCDGRRGEPGNWFLLDIGGLVVDRVVVARRRVPDGVDGLTKG